MVRMLAGPDAEIGRVGVLILETFLISFAGESGELRAAVAGGPDRVSQHGPWAGASGGLRAAQTGTQPLRGKL